MPNTALIILVILFIITLFAFRRDGKDYELFKTFDKTEDRQRFFKKWVNEPFLLYGLLSLILLTLVGYPLALFKMPEPLLDISNQFLSYLSEEDNDSFIQSFLNGLLMSLVPVLLIGPTLGALFQAYQLYKNPDLENPLEKDSRAVIHLLPRNSKERFLTGCLSINAGFSEELFFRVLAPLLIFWVTDSMLLAILGSTLWFGIAHYYQGLAGIIATSIIGLIFMVIYLYTQHLLLVIFIHALIDLNSLVIGPWFLEHLKNRA